MTQQAMWTVDVRFRDDDGIDTFTDVIEVKPDYEWVVIRYLGKADGSPAVHEQWYPRDVVESLSKAPQR